MKEKIEEILLNTPKEQRDNLAALSFLLELELGRGTKSEGKNIDLFIKYVNILRRSVQPNPELNSPQTKQDKGLGQQPEVRGLTSSENLDKTEDAFQNKSEPKRFKSLEEANKYIKEEGKGGDRVIIEENAEPNKSEPKVSNRLFLRGLGKEGEDEENN